MPSATPPPKDVARLTLASSLGVKGSLHIRPYGNVKHAHLVLKKIGEEPFIDEDGNKCSRAVFSLFAHKPINVKAGKELFLYLQSPSGEISEQSIAFEGELLHPGEPSRDDISRLIRSSSPPRKVVLPQERNGGTSTPWADKSWSKMPDDGNTPRENNEQPSLRRTLSSILSFNANSPLSTPVLMPRHVASSSRITFDVRENVLESKPQSPVMTQPKSLLLSAHSQNFPSPSVEPLKVISLLDIPTENFNVTERNNFSDANNSAVSKATVNGTQKQYGGSIMMRNYPMPKIITSRNRGGRVLEKAVQTVRTVDAEAQTAALPSNDIAVATNSLTAAKPSTPLKKPYPDLPPLDTSPLSPELGVHDIASTSQLTIDHYRATSSPLTTNFSSRPPTLSPPPQSPKLPDKSELNGTHTDPIPVSDGPELPAPAPVIKDEPLSPMPRSLFTFTPSHTQGVKSLSFRTADDDSGYVSVMNAQAEDPIYVEDDNRAPSAMSTSLSPAPPSPPQPPPPATREIKQEIIDSAPLTTPIIPSAPELNGSRRTASSQNGKVTPAPSTVHHPIPLPPKPPAPLPYTGNFPRKRRARDQDFYDEREARRVRGYDHYEPPTPSPPPRDTHSLYKIHGAQIPMEGPPGINGIVMNSTGQHFAVVCRDNTVRIWSNKSRSEIAKLQHNASVVAVSWMEGDAGIVSLGANGIVNKWTKLAHNQWHWAKILDTGDIDPVSLAYKPNRIAVSFPRLGVRIWSLVQGSWKVIRFLKRQMVSAIRFVDDGRTIVGGTMDGVMWICELPDGVMAAVAFVKTRIFSVEVDPTENYALLSNAGGVTSLVSLGTKNPEERGEIVQTYATRSAGSAASTNHPFGALFSPDARQIIFGTAGSRILVWNREKGNIVHEMDTGNDIMVQGVAVYTDENGEHSLISANRHGKLTWWSAPKEWSQDKKTDREGDKRTKIQ